MALSAKDAAAVKAAAIQGLGNTAAAYHAGSAAVAAGGGVAADTPQAPTPSAPTQGAAPDPNANNNFAPSNNAGQPPSAQDQQAETKALQDYLVQQGYLTAGQVATGPGVYGPQTTAAVAKLHNDLGVQAPTPQEITQSNPQQLAQKYQNIFSSVQNKGNVDSAGAAKSQIQDLMQQQNQPSTDPVFGAMSSSLGPIMDSLNQVLQNINNPALTAVSLQQEYNSLAQQNNLPGMQTQLLNMQNVMNGTEDDIRDEVSKTGGMATESQVLALTGARNKVILKQYNALSTQYQAAQTNVQNMMQYASQDQATQLQRQTATAGIVENMASIESQMMQMGLTMQSQARSSVQYNVTQTGYSALAASAQGNPQVLGYYEQLLSLAPGTLSNPKALGELDTYKQQQLAISQEQARNAANRTIIYAASQGVGIGGTGGGGTVTSDGSTAPATIPSSSLIRPSWLSSNVPLSMTSQDMTQYAGTVKGAVTGGTAGANQYGNNVTIPGVGNYVAQPDGSYILGAALPPAGTGDVSSLISSIQNPSAKVPSLNYTDIKSIEANPPPSKYGIASTAFYREQRSARQLVGNYISSPVYQTVSQAPLPFARIQAARNGDNSVSDTELLDAYITLAKGQGQITEAQISAVTSASSMSDKLNIIKQKVVGAGALISSDQRKSLLSLSGSVFDEYSTQYRNLYTQAINTLAENHVEPAVWGVVPDFTTMITTGDTNANLNP